MDTQVAVGHDFASLATAKDCERHQLSVEPAAIHTVGIYSERDWCCSFAKDPKHCAKHAVST